MAKDLVSVIIVTAGINDYIRSCLDAVHKQTHYPLEIIVIYNSSGRDLSRALIGNYPGIKLHLSPQNLSYCQALNKGIEMSRGDFILCLNDDVILEANFIAQAMKGFDINQRIGMVSGKILRFNRETMDTTGLFLSLWRTAKERGYGVKDRGQLEEPGYIFGVNGAVAFYREDMLDKIKLDSQYFDNDFRFFYEDLDIAWRAQKLGWRGYYIPSAVAYHLRGGTARKDGGINKKFARRYISDELQMDLIKNRYLTLIKNETFFGFLLHLPFIILYDLFVLGYLILFRFSWLKKFFQNNFPINSAFKKRKLLKTKLLYD